MPALSYREYLDILKGPPRKKRVYKTVLVTLFITAFLTVGTLSALVVFYKRNVEPQVVASSFIQAASAGFISSKQSLNDVLETFQVAGTKVAVIDNLQNSANPETGYFVDLADKQKLLSKIDLAKRNVEFQKQQLQKAYIPPELKSITADLINYYDQSEISLSQAEKDHQFFKNMLLALGPDLYLPVLSNDSVWKEGDKAKITNYYEDKKIKIQVALTNLAKFYPEDDFKDYYNDELAYLGLYVKASTDITNTLNSNPEVGPDSATVVERAYQQLINAQKENSTIPDKLLSEKRRLLELKENLNKFANVRYQANSLEERLRDENSKYEDNKSLLPKVEKMLQIFFHSA